MPKYVVDTNLYIEAIRTDVGNEALAAFQRRFAPFLFQHSTVAQEILAGAGDESAYQAYRKGWVAPFEDLRRIITPSHNAWMQAAFVIVKLVELGEKSPGGFSRSFLNNCLLAASSVEHGFVVVTRNLADFRLIQQVEPRMQYAKPWPER